MQHIGERPESRQLTSTDNCLAPRLRAHASRYFSDARFSGQRSVGARSPLWFRFFEAGEVKVAAIVAGDDETERIGKCTATRTAIAGKGGKDFSGFQRAVSASAGNTVKLWDLRSKIS